MHCSFQDFKEFTDAEGVISLPTSDFHKPICQEMRLAAANRQAGVFGLLAAGSPPPLMQGPLLALPPPPLPLQPTSLSGATVLLPAISQSSSTSSSYGTTTSTTIALPLDASMRYGAAICSSSNFNHNFNNNFNTTTANGVLLFGGGNYNGNNNNNADLASVDSSDTYASCQTHPFLSQGDLTADFNDEACALDIDMDNLYINPLEREQHQHQQGISSSTGFIVGLPATNSSGALRAQVKKSASGDTALRNLASGGPGVGGLSPLDDVYQSFDVQERGSRVSLNENSVPKHRKTRFQQSFTAMRPTSAASSGSGISPGMRPRARFEDTRLDDETGAGRLEGMGQGAVGSGASGSLAASGSGGFGGGPGLGPGPKKKRSVFMPGKSLATATKLINQHLFGIQNVGAKGG